MSVHDTCFIILICFDTNLINKLFVVLCLEWNPRTELYCFLRLKIEAQRVGPFQFICFGISWITMWQGHVKIWVSRFGYDVGKTVFLSSYIRLCHCTHSISQLSSFFSIKTVGDAICITNATSWNSYIYSYFILFSITWGCL